jgi:hypothetical protein
MLAVEAAESSGQGLPELSGGSQATVDLGFPLSTFLRRHCTSLLRSLTRNSLGLSCQTIYSSNSSGPRHLELDALQNVGFRSALQCLLEQEGLKVSGAGRKKLSGAKQLGKATTFGHYSDIALTALGHLPDLAESGHWAAKVDARDAFFVSLAPRLKALAPFTACQLLLSQMVERVILLDRVLYVREAGLCAGLYTIFDPAVSPRNQMLVATKSSEHATEVAGLLGYPARCN